MGDFRIASHRLRAVTAGAVAVALLAGLTGCSLFGSPTTPTPSSTPSASSGDVIDPSIPSDSPTPTPTEDTPTPVDSASASASASATPTVAPVSAKKSVVPFITSAEWDPKAKELDVSGIVPSVHEKDGTCTITATLGATTKTNTSKAVATSSYTGCETVSFSGLASGGWTVRMTYVSSTSAGASAARTVTVG